MKNPAAYLGRERGSTFVGMEAGGPINGEAQSHPAANARPKVVLMPLSSDTAAVRRV